VLPLATAAVGALLHRQRPSKGFWACAALGSVLVVAFAMLKSGSASGLSLRLADLLLLAAMLCAAVGYGYGARLSQHMRAENVICWALIISLPLTLPLALISLPQAPVKAAAWWGFGYVAVFSMWLGFFAWYRGLALGGTVRVSQVQLVQPFLSMLFAVPLLGERLDAVTVGFGLAVIATVFVGKKMPVGKPA
jgi:drug/metabolite transporter (DMT)-like permease